MTKYTIKLILWKHDPNPVGHLPIYLQITVNRKTRYKSTGHYIAERQWDAKKEQLKESHPLAETINLDILNKKAGVVKTMVMAQTKGDDTSAAQMKYSLGRNLNNISQFVKAYHKELKGKRQPSTLYNQNKHLKKLLKYNGSENLAFEEITVEYLAKYEQHCRLTDSDNYIWTHWSVLRTFFNAAKKKKIISHYPFPDYENPEYKKTDRDYLTLDEIYKLERFVDTFALDARYKMVGAYLLLSCCTGLRVSDWPKFNLEKNVVNGRVHLRAKKNKGWVTMQVNSMLTRAIDKVKYFPCDYTYDTLLVKVKALAEAAGIKKKVTPHTGRHTFAITICAEQGVSVETCAELMGIAVKTCYDNYYRVTNTKIDKETSTAWATL